MTIHWHGGTFKTAMERAERYWAEQREALAWQARLDTAFDSKAQGKPIHIDGPEGAKALAQVADKRLAEVGMR